MGVTRGRKRAQREGRGGVLHTANQNAELPQIACPIPIKCEQASNIHDRIARSSADRTAKKEGATSKDFASSAGARREGDTSDAIAPSAISSILLQGKDHWKLRSVSFHTRPHSKMWSRRSSPARLHIRCSHWRVCSWKNR